MKFDYGIVDLSKIRKMYDLKCVPIENFQSRRQVGSLSPVEIY